MNSKILEHYRELIRTNLEYLKSATIKSSIEEYKTNLIEETAKLELESHRTHNQNFINSFYSESIATLKEGGDEMNSCIHTAIKNLNTIDLKQITESIKEQIESSLTSFELKEEYKSFNGLLFEYNSNLSFSGIAFKEPKFEINLEKPKYLEFQDGSYASDHPIDFELEEALGSILSEEFDEIAWAFDFELDIFLKTQETVYSIAALALHAVLDSEDIKNTLKQKGFENNGVVYLYEHDNEEKPVFVNE
ncbi:hypothetical protein [Aquimarina sp. AU119]|uniref:hypothetical protein n=1 Tax=Aquimarina sp. AU119 TaxID=2108528 RepID=UPI000D69D2FA|nr:hypothetical protein [Aquimarina sp. AU119]